jgi:phosphatidylinositol alpha-1,6-mannosyltransferase
MKKILLATLEFPPHIGGIATYTEQFARSLPPEKVCVYAPETSGDRAYDEHEAYTIIRKKPFFFLWWPRWIRTILQFLAIVKKEQIEIIAVNHVLPLGYAAWVVKKIKKIPYIILSHGTDVIYATARPWKKKMLTRLVSDAEQVVFNSESLKRRFLEHLPDYASKSTVLYPCPDVSLLAPPDASEVEELRRTLALQGKKVILSVSRLDRGKGFQHLVHALPDILKKEPHTVWVIVGDGSKRSEIFEAVQKLSLQNVVRFVGAVPHHELQKYYHLADVFVLLTHRTGDREEGLGLVFLEAAAAGIPVVAGASGGVGEAVVDGVTGRVFDVSREAGRVVDAIVELLGDEEMQQTLGEAGKKRIQDIFQWKKQLTHLEPWVGTIEYPNT